MTKQNQPTQSKQRLSDLPLGESAFISRIEIKGDQRRRLMDLGLLPGTRITAEIKAPLGEPIAYRVRGALIAFRKEVADHVFIEDSLEEVSQ